MNTPENSGTAVNKTAAYNVHVEKMEKRLKYWGAELDKVAQTALSFEANQREEFERQRVELQKKLDLAQNKLEALRGAGEHKWEAFKEELDLSVRRLETAFTK